MTCLLHKGLAAQIEKAVKRIEDIEVILIELEKDIEMQYAIIEALRAAENYSESVIEIGEPMYISAADLKKKTIN